MKWGGADLPSTFYRVTAKALIFNAQRELLVIKAQDGKYEMPGGGWEHDETITECLEREVREELGVDVAHIGDVACVYRGLRPKGYHTIRIVFVCKVTEGGLCPGEGMCEARFVGREEFLKLPFAHDEAPIIEHADKIWQV